MLYGFLLLLLFFLLLNLDRRFRDHAKRSLLRPFNFFADLRDRRMLPNSQTSLLAIILAGGVGLCVGALLHDAYKVSETNNALGAMLPIGLRSWALAEDGTYFGMVLWLSLVALAAMFFVVLVLRFIAIFRKGRIMMGDTFNVTVWACLPFVLLLPFDLILPRMDIDFATVQLATFLLVAIVVWTYYRLLKGVGVLFDVYPARLYIYGTLGLAVAALVLSRI